MSIKRDTLVANASITSDDLHKLVDKNIELKKTRRTLSLLDKSRINTASVNNSVGNVGSSLGSGLSSNVGNGLGSGLSSNVGSSVGSSVGNGLNTASADDIEDVKVNDVINSIYKSMSNIIDALNTDNVILNQQVKKIHDELSFVCDTIAPLKLEMDAISELIKKQSLTIVDVQKQLNNTRNVLMQTLDIHMKNIKKELSDIKKSQINKDQINKMILEHVDKLILT